MKINFDNGRCDYCGVCVAVCPLNIITIKDTLILVDYGQCTMCKRCEDHCPLGAVHIVEKEKISNERLS